MADSNEQTVSVALTHRQPSISTRIHERSCRRHAQATAERSADRILCLNLALIGLIAITLMRGGMHRFERHDEKLSLSAQSLMRMVPAEQTKIQAIIDAHRPKMRELRHQR